MGLSQILLIASDQTLVNKHESALFDGEKPTSFDEKSPPFPDGENLTSSNGEKPTSCNGKKSIFVNEEKSAFSDEEKEKATSSDGGKAPSFEDEKPISTSPKTSPTSGHVKNVVDPPAPEEDELEWRLGRQELSVMISLMLVSLVAALDATVLVPVLPAGPLLHPSRDKLLTMEIDHCKCSQRKRQ